MKKGVVLELRAYAPRYMLPLRAVQSITQFLIGVYLCAMVGWHASQSFLPIAVYTDVLFDYVAFSGVSIRRQKTMEWVKSSVAGEGFIRRAISQDFFIRMIATMSGYLGVMVCGFIAEESSISDILAPVVFIPFTIFAGNLVIIISHRVGGTVNTPFLICLPGIIGGEIIAVLLGLFLFGGTRIVDRMMFIKIWAAFAVLAALAVATSIWLLRDFRTGYESGFSDSAGDAGNKEPEQAAKLGDL